VNGFFIKTNKQTNKKTQNPQKNQPCKKPACS